MIHTTIHYRTLYDTLSILSYALYDIFYGTFIISEILKPSVDVTYSRGHVCYSMRNSKII